MFNEGLAPVKINSKWSYINDRGKIIIKTNFDKVGPFKEGLAPFVLNNKQGYINKKGEIIIKPQFALHYKSPNHPGFKDGMASVNINNKVGFINRVGKVVIEPKYDQVRDFNEGLSVVGMKKE